MPRDKTVAWVDPEKSIGRQSATVKGKTVWEATGPAKEIFEEKLSGIIQELLKANKEDLQSREKTSPAACFHLWMVGRDPQSARPTVIFACKSSAFRRKIIRFLEEKNVLADFPGMALKSMERMPAEPMGQEHNPFRSQLYGETHDLDEGGVYLRPGNDGVCGSSILVGNKYEATLGGILLINGTYFGFTTIHSRLGGNGGVESLAAADAEMAFDDDSDIASIRTQSLRSKYSKSVLSFHRPSIEIDSSAGEIVFDEKNASASPDSENFSAGFRRIGTVIRDNAKRAFDYDIFSVEDSALHVPNQIALPRVDDRPQEFLRIDSILTAVIESEVWIATGKSGLLKGTIMNNPYFIKMAGSENYQKMWPVILEKDIVPGDCGSWVVDAQSGSLYGHIVAGDALLHRAYIIPATDVIGDMTARYGHNPILPGLRAKPHRSMGPIHVPKRGLRRRKFKPAPSDNESKSTIRNGSQYTQSPSDHSSIVHSYLSDCFTKIWDPEFSKDRKIKDNDSHVEIMRRLGALSNGFDDNIFGLTGGSMPRNRIEEMENFYQDARLVDLKAGIDIAGQRRAAWLDDRSSELSSNEWREYEDTVITATALYRRLKIPRFGCRDLPDANRRLIYIRNLNPQFILSLVETASFEQVPALRDAIWNHITFQTSIRVKIPNNRAIFELQFHIPYFALRIAPSNKRPPSGVGNYNTPKRRIDISFLQIPGESHHLLHEAHISLAICGSDNGRWVGYFFDNTFENDEELEDEVIPCEGVHMDPISSGTFDANYPFWDPREYFLIILKIRIHQVQKEWESLVRTIELYIKESSYQHSPTLTKSSRSGGTDVKEIYDWTQQIIYLIAEIRGVLLQTVNSWERFNSSSGDIGYFSDSPQRTRLSLRAINEAFESLQVLRQKLRYLEESCRDSAAALQLRLAIEANEAVRKNRWFTQFTTSIILPVIVAIAFFSIPKNDVAFKLEAKYFWLAIILIMAVVQLLFVGLTALPGLPWWWDKITSWMTQVRLWERYRKHPATEIDLEAHKSV